MDSKRIKENLLEFIPTIKITDSIFFEEGKENAAKLIEEDTLLSIGINDKKIPLFKFSSKDELDELYSWNVIKNVVIKEDTLKCLIIDTNKVVQKNCISKNSDEEIGYKIIINPEEVLENWELFIANLPELLDIGGIKEDFESYYYKECERLVKEQNLCIIEFNNLKKMGDKLLKNIFKKPLEFIRTNLLIINKDSNSLLTLYEFYKQTEIESKNVCIDKISYCQYPFFLELLCFLESAQNLKHNHLKYIDYYHVLEYFITDYAYRNLESSIKSFLSIYLEGGGYEKFRRALVKLAEDNQIVSLSKDQPLFDVLRQIDLKYIQQVINSNNLFNELKKDIFGNENSKLITSKWAKPNTDKITHIEIDDSESDEFYKRLQSRIYRIRNTLIHSQAKFRGKARIDFLPTEEYEKQLKEDVILIRELAIKLCRIECVDILKEL